MNSEWRDLKIEQVVEKIETCDPRKLPDEKFEYIDVSSVSRTTLSITETTTLKGEKAPSRARRRVRSGDVIFATIRPTLRRIAQVPPDLDGAVCSTGFFPLRPKDGLLSRYIFYWLLGSRFSEAMDKLQRGASYPAVSDSDVRRQIISIPSTKEQKRIVAILDEAFAGIETAIANTEKNLANARELFESYADRAVADLSGDKRCLKDCVEHVSTGPFGSLLHKSDYVSEGLPLVNPINIVDSRIVADDKKRVDEDTLERLSAYVLRKGDVVVARRGEIGRCAVVEPDQDGWLCGTGCFFVRPKKELNPHFLVNLIRSETGRSELLRRATGATMKNLGNKALGTFELRLPPRELQDRMIEQLAELQNANHELTQVFRRKLKSLNELKQSLLQKAFSGELTADRADREVESVAISTRHNREEYSSGTSR